MASCPDTRNMTLYNCHANVFPEFRLEKLFLTFQRDCELFKITVDKLTFYHKIQERISGETPTSMLIHILTIVGMAANE